MLDIRKPLGLLFILLGAILFFYGAFLQQEVLFYTPQTKFPLKLNQPVGLFMFAFGIIMWQLSRYVNIVRLERGLKAREKELEGRPSTETQPEAPKPADDAPAEADVKDESEGSKDNDAPSEKAE